MSTTRSDSPKAPATDPRWRGASLLLCAHGVRGGPGVAARHATAIEALGVFAGAEACCLYGAPGLETALGRATTGRAATERAYVVPLLMAEGHSYDALAERITVARAHLPTSIGLCRPVGSHAGLAALIAGSAQRTCRVRGWRASETALLLIGHGTRRNTRSGDSLRHHREALAAGGDFAEVGHAFLDDDPSVADTLDAMKAERTVAVGFFADAGPHGADDVARLLAGRERAVAYAGPVGCDAGLVDAILDRVRQEDVSTLAA